MSTSQRYDAIVIGTGAGGGTLLSRLAGSGKRILVLERGPFLPRERENWDRAAIAAGRYRAALTWHDADGKPFQPFTHHFVGGNTKLYGGALLRLREHDFGEVRHHGGISPAWPITYDELEPYYSEAEWLYHVHGRRGDDPHEPRSSRPYAHAPVAHEPRIAELEEQLRGQGLRPFALPLAVRPTERNAPSVHLSLFDGFPDPTETKADAHVIGVAPALQHANVELRTGCYVERLLTSASGREVTGVVARTAGGVETFAGDIVVVACGAIESAALLLRSVSAAHPRGLANEHDLVGRHYMCHHNGALLAVAAGENPSQFQKTLALTDFYRSGPSSDLPLGAVQLMGRSAPGDFAGLEGIDPTTAAARSIDFWLTAEDLPDPENRVVLRSDGSLQLSYRPNNLTAFEGLKQALSTVLSRAFGGRLQLVSYRLDVSGVSHQCGTLRFGHDPRTSVLDLQCRAHGVDNLYAVDGSFFPASGAVNPSLTIMANALRVGDHLLARLGAARVAAE